MTESGKAQENTGRLEEAVGALSGDEERAREGRKDKAAGKLRRAGERIRESHLRRRARSARGSLSL